MAINTEVYKSILHELELKQVTLVAVSKTKSIEDIQQLYDLGQRDFGENYVQELCDKQPALPKDIRWHFIGHLQSNKVKYIAEFVHLIHGVDSLKLLKEINKQAHRLNKTINVLIQVYVATEETKFGLDFQEVVEFAENYQNSKEEFSHISILGVMGMASFSDDAQKVRNEFISIREIFNTLKHRFFIEDHFNIISMGMSGDYEIAIEENSNMVRIGSLIFGSR